MFPRTDEIKRLKNIKRAWLAETYPLSYLKKYFGLKEDDIVKIKPSIQYGTIRYHKRDVAQYLDQKLRQQNQ